MQQAHAMLWGAIDNLARANNMSCSRMATICNMNSSTFNKSKRFNHYGKAHWMSAETLLKIMQTMNVSWTEFA